MAMQVCSCRSMVDTNQYLFYRQKYKIKFDSQKDLHIFFCVMKHCLAHLWRIRHRSGVFRFLAVADDHHHRHTFWHQPLSCRCKGMSAGFGNILLLLLVLLKNISNAFKTIWTSLSKTKGCFSMIGILLVFHSCRQKKL